MHGIPVPQTTQHLAASTSQTRLTRVFAQKKNPVKDVGPHGNNVHHMPCSHLDAPGLYIERRPMVVCLSSAVPVTTQKSLVAPS